MQLLQKQTTFSPFWAGFPKSRLKFKYFWKKDDPDEKSFIFPRLRNPEM